MRTALRTKPIGGGTASLQQDIGGAEEGTAHQPKGKHGARFFQIELINRARFHSKCWD